MKIKRKWILQSNKRSYSFQKLVLVMFTEKKKKIYIYIYTHTHTHTYIYIERECVCVCGKKYKSWKFASLINKYVITEKLENYKSQLESSEKIILHIQ